MSRPPSGSVARVPISVFLLMRYRILADMLSGLLGERPEFSLAGVAAEPSQALTEISRRDDVDVLVLDVKSCPAPARFVREVAQCSMSTKVLPTSVSPEKDVVELLEAGACGYVPINASLDELLVTIGQVHRHQAPCCPVVIEAVLDRLKELSDGATPTPIECPLATLTDKELTVLELLALGSSNRQLSSRLGLSISTIKTHVRSILAKLRVERRQDAALVAAELGLLRNGPPAPTRTPNASR